MTLDDSIHGFAVVTYCHKSPSV